MSESQYAGCMLGLALGDALGARHEGSHGDAELGVVQDLRWTDDTQMAIGLAESLIERDGVDEDHLAKRWADLFEPWRGYGPNARAMLALVKQGTPWRDANRTIFPAGSFGNGAAMRAAPLGLFFAADGPELRAAALRASQITHAHPLGAEGGVVISRAVAMALKGPFEPAQLIDETREDEFRRRLKIAQEWLGQNVSLTQVRNKLGKNVEAAKSAVTAIHCFLRHPADYLEMIRYVVRLGGDTDTIGAMAGGIFGARNGVESLPEELVARLEAADHLRKLATSLFAKRKTAGA